VASSLLTYFRLVNMIVYDRFFYTETCEGIAKGEDVVQERTRRPIFLFSLK